MMRKFFIILLLCAQALQISWAAAYGIAGAHSLEHELHHAVEAADHHDQDAHAVSEAGCSDCCAAHACHAPVFPCAEAPLTPTANTGSAAQSAFERQHHSRDFSGRIDRPKWSAA
jgi:hypothetical protein